MIFIVGPSKTGTDFLHTFVNDCKNFDVISGKSTFFFTDHFHRGLDWYLGYFSNNGKEKVEVCHDYFSSENAMSRISAHYPDAKIILTVRDPIQRSVSSILYYRKNGYTGSLKNLISRNPSIIEESLYNKYYELWRQYFPATQIFILHFEDLGNPDNLRKKFETILSQTLDVNVLKHSEKRNSAKKARNYLLARLVKWMALYLRRLGFGKLVYTVHSSKIVDKILYKDIANVDRAQIELEFLNCSEALKIIDDYKIFNNLVSKC